MKSRDGKTIKLQELFDEAINRALQAFYNREEENQQVNLTPEE